MLLAAVQTLLALYRFGTWSCARGAESRVLLRAGIPSTVVAKVVREVYDEKVWWGKADRSGAKGRLVLFHLVAWVLHGEY